MSTITENTSTELTYDDDVLEESYWNGNGKYQEQYDSLSRLVPAKGFASTVEGEMLRAASRLYYDYYNNGFCNNTSYAYRFLLEKSESLGLGIEDDLGEIRNESYSLGYTERNLEVELENIVNGVLKYIIDKDQFYEENNENMLNF
jgi:hypothetical protein